METREQILDASRELFYRHGFRRITMDDIARHMGISKKTVYKFYSDKEAIVNRLADFDFEQERKLIKNLNKQSDNAIHEIFLIMKHVGELFSRINPSLFYDMQKYHRYAWKVFCDFKCECVTDVVAGNLRRGIKEGLYRDNIDVNILSQLRSIEIEMAVNPDVFPPGKYNLMDVQMQLLLHFLHGIASLKGHKLINKYMKINEKEN